MTSIGNSNGRGGIPAVLDNSLQDPIEAKLRTDTGTPKIELDSIVGDGPSQVPVNVNAGGTQAQALPTESHPEIDPTHLALTSGSAPSNLAGDVVVLSGSENSDDAVRVHFDAENRLWLHAATEADDFSITQVNDMAFLLTIDGETTALELNAMPEALIVTGYNSDDALDVAVQEALQVIVVPGSDGSDDLQILNLAGVVQSENSDAEASGIDSTAMFDTFFNSGDYGASYTPKQQAQILASLFTT